MKIWMSPPTEQKRGVGGFTARAVVGIAGIGIAAFILVVGVAALTISAERNKELISLAACAAAVALVLWMAVSLGRSLHRDAVIFCRDEEDRLYVADVRQWVGWHRGLLGYLETAASIQRCLARVREQLEDWKSVPDQALEICNVNGIREHARHYALVCQVRDRDGRRMQRTILLMKGYEGEEELLRELERRQSWENKVEAQADRNLFLGIVCLAALAVSILLCILSHPACGQLPGAIYFPCLGMAFLAFGAMLYFLIRHRRGES